MKKINQLLYHFAAGDALGDPFEFNSPTTDEIEQRFSGQDKISFTDDTYLFISTLEGLKKSNHFMNENSDDRSSFWKEMKNATCEFLLD